MNNRYNELNDQQKNFFDLMINSVASHRNTIGDDLVEKTYWHARKLERELWDDMHPQIVAIMFYNRGNCIVRQVRGDVDEILSLLVWPDGSKSEVGDLVCVLLSDYDTSVLYKNTDSGWEEVGVGSNLDKEELALWGFVKIQSGVIEL